MIADGTGGSERGAASRGAASAGSDGEIAGEDGSGRISIPEHINLDADQVLELFMALFNNPSIATNAMGSSGAAAAAARASGHSSGARVAAASSFEDRESEPMQRVYSIDTDSSQNSVAASPEQHPYGNTPLKEGFDGGSGDSDGDGAHDVAATGSAMRMDIQGEDAGSAGDGIAAYSSNGSDVMPNNTSFSYPENRAKRTKTPPLHPSTSAITASSSNHPLEQRQQQQQAQLDGDRKDSRDSTISLDLANNQLIVVSHPGTAVAGASVGTSSGANMGNIGADNHTPQSPNGGASQLAKALQKLRQVDIILEQLSVFWANTEVVLDLLTQKGQHVEQFIAFSAKPRLMARFKERMEEYKRFWEGIQSTCANYITGVSQNANYCESKQPMYAFLEKPDGTLMSSFSAGST